MKREIYECEEFDELRIGIGALIENGEITIDERIRSRGYLNVSLRSGQVVLRADRHVGLIPLNARLAVRVTPRATIRNLSHMLAKSGIAPTAIADFSRGYIPRFEVGSDAERIYYKSLMVGVNRVVGRGLMKSYAKVERPPAWRGRFLVSETIRRQLTRGVKYRHEFEFHALSVTTIENMALKEAVRQARDWLRREDRKNVDLLVLEQLLSDLRHVEDWKGRIGTLVNELGARIAMLPPHLNYYRDALWTAFLLLQNKLPDVTADGSVSLDSLIIDVSKVFEAYVRRVLEERVERRGWKVTDGTNNPSSFFSDSTTYEVKPDIVIRSGLKPLAVLDAKYKLDPKEADRYELLSFMEALGVKLGGFISPQRAGQQSRYLGTTAGNKEMFSLRFDLGAADLGIEGDRLFNNVVALIDSTRNFN